jgi:hypothetical protein
MASICKEVVQVGDVLFDGVVKRLDAPRLERRVEGSAA